MSEHNTFNAATTGSNDDANQAIDDQSNCVDTSGRMDVSDGNGDGTSMNDSFNGNHGNGDDKQSNANSSMRTIDEEKPSEFDGLRDDEIIAMMNNQSEQLQNEGKNDDNAHHNEDFAVAYSGDTAMMESNPNGSNAHHYYDSHNDQDFDNASTASQGASEGGDSNYSDGTFHDNENGKMRIASSSSSDEAASWFEKAKNAASENSTPQASNTTNDEEGREEAKQLKGGHKASGGLQDLQDASSESTQIMKDISSKLDEKLDSTRLLTKRLLEEMTVYVQSLQTVASEYQRIRESELRESQRLDAVEPEVNGASGMLLGGESGEFIGTSIEQQKQQKAPSSESRHRRHSLPKEEHRPMRPRRDRPLTPIVGNRRRSKIDRDGKENHASHRRSFG